MANSAVEMEGNHTAGVSRAGLAAELRVSPGPVAALLAGIGLAMIVLSHVISAPTDPVRVATLGLLLLLIPSVCLLMDGRAPALARGCMVAGLLAFVHLADAWFALPGCLSLVALPVTLAAALIGVPAGLLAGAGETLVLGLLSAYRPPREGPPALIVPIVVTWGALGIVWAMGHQAGELGQWLEQYYDHARRLKEELETRRSDLFESLEELRLANRQLALMNERVTALRLIAEEAQKSKARFVARVSHEFRTPLNIIIGLVELIADSPERYDVTLSPRMREALQVVRRNCELLSGMVSDVLDLTRIETDRVTLRRERLQLGDVIASAAEAVQPLLRGKGVALRIAVPAELPEVYCDRVRIEQVVLNLLSNAARHTDEGEIRVRAQQRDQRILVTVEDTGSGIAAHEVTRLFEPFFQGTGEIRQRRGTSGLGLTISKHFVELHGGRMWVESELGVGTTFSFELPISPPLAHSARPGHQIREDWIWLDAQHQAVSAPLDRRPRVVVVDLAGSLSGVLPDWSADCEVVAVGSAGRLGEVLRQGPAHAILINADSPEQAWAAVVAARELAPGCAVVGCSVPRGTDRAAELGALGYLVKPVRRADLADALRAVDRPVRRALVVDDDPDALQLFRQMLTLCDTSIEVCTASDGEEALTALRSVAPDLMLLDLVMPDLDGWQVLARMATDDTLPRVPTFIVSAQDPAEEAPKSECLVASVGEGLPAHRILRCTLELSRLLMCPEQAPHPAPG